MDWFACMCVCVFSFHSAHREGRSVASCLYVAGIIYYIFKVKDTGRKNLGGREGGEEEASKQKRQKKNESSARERERERKAQSTRMNSDCTGRGGTRERGKRGEREHGKRLRRGLLSRRGASFWGGHLKPFSPCLALPAEADHSGETGTEEREKERNCLYQSFCATLDQRKITTYIETRQTLNEEKTPF